MLVLKQAWLVSRQALVPTCVVSAWVIGSLLGTRLRATPRLWGVCLSACSLLWILGPQLVSWRIAHVSAALLNKGALLGIALLLGALSTAWLLQPRSWPAVGEHAILARGLIGITGGLCIVWFFPTLAGLIARICILPLLVLDYWPAGRSPLPATGGVVENWVSRYWSTQRWQVQLDGNAFPRTWWWSYLVERERNSRGYLQLTLLASSSAIIVGAVWGAVPTPFAAELAATHELGKLGWLLGGQIVALAVGACFVMAARNVVGFPDRVVPTSWQARVLTLALSMLVVLAVSLVALGLPFLQAPWWLALSVVSFTLAGAVWGYLLPRLKPSLNTVMHARRHSTLGTESGLMNPLRLAHAQALEADVNRFFATAEGVLIAAITPVLGALIDFYGSVDRVLIIVGLCTLLLLTVWALVSVLRLGDKQRYKPYRQCTRFAFPPLSSRVGRSHVRLSW
jgi:hypothetical protein